MYQRILVPLDGSLLAAAILPYVENLASKPGAEIVLFRVLPASGVFPDTARKEELAAWIDLRFEERLLKEKGLAASISIRHSSDAAEEISDFADKNDIDLIAMSTHGRSGVSRLLFGSVAEKVLRGTSKPILLIRAKETQTAS
ncbi:MAG: universal stress protein [Chloroflexi bacterium]|nr:universal stress protein [Chloroflexota bacterium]